MRLEQKDGRPAESRHPLPSILLPDGRRIFLKKDGPARTIIELLIEAGKKKQPWISGEDIMKALKPKYPDIDNLKLRAGMIQATFILKPTGFAVISEETRSRGASRQPESTSQRQHRYTLGTREQKLAQKPKKREPQTANRKQPKLEPIPESLNGKEPATRFEWPDQRAARLAGEAKKREEARKIFINRFSSVIVSQIANNPDDNLHHAANLDRDLEAFLKNVNPSFKELIGENSVKYLGEFFLDALFAKLTQWWKVEDLRTVPALEQSAVTNCIQLKKKGLTVADVLNETSKHFSIPIAPVNALHS